MDTKTPKPEMPEETPEERERLLSRYSARDRWLIEDVLKAHPTLTAAEAIEHLESGGIKEQESESWALVENCEACKLRGFVLVRSPLHSVSAKIRKSLLRIRWRW
jgi:hypothetical protein